MNKFSISVVAMVAALYGQNIFAAECNGTDNWAVAGHDFRVNFGLDIDEGHINSSSGELVKAFFGSNTHITTMLSSVTHCTRSGFKVLAHSAAPMVYDLATHEFQQPHDDQCGTLSIPLRAFAAQTLSKFFDPSERTITPSDLTVCLNAGDEDGPGLQTLYVRGLIRESDGSIGHDLSGVFTYDGKSFQYEYGSASSPGFPMVGTGIHAHPLP